MDGIKVSGDAIGGWLVEMHNGKAFHAVTSLVETEEDAVKTALQAWKDKFKIDFVGMKDTVKAGVTQVEAAVNDEVKVVAASIKKIEDKVIPPKT